MFVSYGCHEKSQMGWLKTDIYICFYIQFRRWEPCSGLTGLKSGCGFSSDGSEREFISLLFPPSGDCRRSLAHGPTPFQPLIQPHVPSLIPARLPPFHMNLCDYIEFTPIIQENLPILRSLISSVKPLLPCKVNIFTGYRISTRTSLAGWREGWW